MAKKGTTIADGAEAVLTNHYMIRDGSFWSCRNRCGLRIPFPSPMPDSSTLGECVPRRWADSEPPPVDGRPAETPTRSDRLPAAYTPVRGGPSALDRPCPKCGAGVRERCRDGRKVGAAPTLRPHQERRTRADHQARLAEETS